MVVCELFDDLTVDLILQRFGLQRPFKDLVCQLVHRASPFGRVVAHVLHDRWALRQGITLTHVLAYKSREIIKKWIENSPRAETVADV